MNCNLCLVIFPVRIYNAVSQGQYKLNIVSRIVLNALAKRVPSHVNSEAVLKDKHKCVCHLVNLFASHFQNGFFR